MATTRRTKKDEPGTNVATIDNTTGTAIATNDVKAAIAAMLAQQEGTTGSTASRGVRITQDKKFELPDGTKHDTIEVVIVDYASFNAFYEGAYDPRNPQPPLCAAKGKKIIELVPFANAPDPQADNCENCPMNQWGSGGGNSKACKNQRVLAVLPADFDEDSDLTLINVSPTAIKRFDKMIGAIAAKGRVPLNFITELSFDPNQSYASLVFTPFEELPIDKVSLALTKLTEAQKLLTEAPDFTPREAQNAAPAKKAPAAKPAAGGRRRAAV